MAIYPNPASERIHFTGLVNKQRVRIYSITGVLVLDETLEHASEGMDISSLPQGGYIVHLVESQKALMLNKQ